MRLPTAREIHKVADVASDLAMIALLPSVAVFAAVIAGAVLYAAISHIVPGLLP